MTRQINAAGEALIEQFEGCALIAYQDQGGIWTIGYGHTGPDVTEGLAITQDQAEYLLGRDLQTAEGAINRLVTVPLGDNQFSALVSLVFNIGVGAFQSSTLLRDLNTGSYGLVQFQIVNGVIDAGLQKRRAAEIALWNTPDSIAT
jgi:lysozyme